MLASWLAAVLPSDGFAPYYSYQRETAKPNSTPTLAKKEISKGE